MAANINRTFVNPDYLQDMIEKSKNPFETRWPQMRPVILKILKQQNVSQAEWQELFYNSYMICLWEGNGAEKIRTALYEDIMIYILEAQRRILSHEDDEALLRAYTTEWKTFYQQCHYLPAPFKLLDNHKYGLRTRPASAPYPYSDQEEAHDVIVRRMMLDCWNDCIFLNVKDRLHNCVMKLLEMERNGASFDSLLVISVRESYVNMRDDTGNKWCVYTDHFERYYLDATINFYDVQANDYLGTHTVNEFIMYSEQKIREEEMRAAKYLDQRSESMKKLRTCLLEIFVTKYKDILLAECPALIKSGNHEDLFKLFQLMDKIKNGVDPILKHFEHHIMCRGLEEVNAMAVVLTQDCEKYVDKLLVLYKEFSDLIVKAFRNDSRFLTARDQAFKGVVNDTNVFTMEIPSGIRQAGQKAAPESRCPELLANYCDMLLRKTSVSKRLTSEQIETRLNNVLLVLKYVQNKDVFMRFHKAHLTRRLLLESSADSEKEENMVDSLRELGMPSDFVSKLSRMFQDLKVSHDLNQQFKAYCKKKCSFPVEAINLKILNFGAWSRGGERVTVSLPMELEEYVPEIEDFYKMKHSGRKLQWYHHMSNGTVVFYNEAGKFELDVTTFQMAVLFAWNARPKDKLTYADLRLATELPEMELKRTLWSLVALPKIKKQVLLYGPEVQAPKDLTDRTSFWINEDFSPMKNGKAQKRGKLSMIGRLQLATAEASTEDDNRAIVQLRVYRTQEAIIQIMKMRKKIRNNQLQMELVEILKNMFLPTKKLIKEQIEWLIERQYMKRDESDLNVFVHLS